MAGGFRRLDVVVGEDETGHGRVLETGRLNFWPVSSLGCRSTSSERPRLGRCAPVAVASGVSAIARCTECGPARWWCNSTAPRREDATSWRLCCPLPWRVLRAPLRGCQCPRRRPSAGPGPRTPCSEPLRRKWRRMAPFTADSTSWCRRAPACAALHPLPASGRIGVYTRSVVVVEDCIGGPT